jgi:hypothetical protein
MRAKLIIAALLCSTAMPAHADPVTAFIGGLLNALGAGTWLASGAVGAWSAGFTVGATLGGTLIGRLVLSLGLNAIATKLSAQTVSPAAAMSNYSQPISYMQRGYGICRVGGPIGFTGFKNRKRHYTILVAAHSTVGPLEHWLSDREVEIDGSGNITTGDMANRGNIRPFTGGQSADATLMAEFPEITSEYDFAGLSGAHLWAKRVAAERLQKVYPDNDIWTYAPVWKLNDQIYDPRTDTYGWTDNAALIIAHEVVNYLGAEVDWAEIAQEADVCDETVTNGEGGTQKRWTINRTFLDDQEWEAIRAELIVACDGFIYERRDGKVGLKVGRYIAPTVTLTAEDFLSLTIDSGEDLGANTQYVIRYVEPLNKYYETPTGTYVHDAEARRVTSEIQAYAINSHNQACRVAKRIARVEHASFRIQGTLKLIGFELIGERFVNFVHEEMGISCVLEIGKLVAGDVALEISAASVTSEDFAFIAATEEPERPSYDRVESEDDVDDLEGLTGEVLDSNGSATILYEWTVPDESYHVQLRVKSPTAGIDDWQVITMASEATSYVLTGLVDGAQYEAQGRNRTTSGNVGEWKPNSPVLVTAVANTTAPGDLTGFAASPSGSNVDLTWTAPNDEAYFATRIWRAATSDFGSASAIHVEYGIASDADAYTDSALSAGTYYYWAEAINASGVAGARSGPESATII